MSSVSATVGAVSQPQRYLLATGLDALQLAEAYEIR